MLANRLRRWPNIVPALIHCPVLAESWTPHTPSNTKHLYNIYAMYKCHTNVLRLLGSLPSAVRDIIVLGPDQNLVPIGVTKLYCDFQLDTYMRGLKMYDGLFRTVAQGQ